MNTFFASVFTRLGKQLASLFSWVREVHTDPLNDLGSYVRVSGMFVIVSTVALVWYSTVVQKDIQPLAQSVLLSLIAVVLGSYIANKYAKPSTVKHTVRTPDVKESQADEKAKE